MEDVLLFIENLQQDLKSTILEKVESWKYIYMSYPTMMKDKKSFEKGRMAEDLAQKIILQQKEAGGFYEEIL